MPVAHVYAEVPPDRRAPLLTGLSEAYAEVLGSPVERVRVLLVAPVAAAVGGRVGVAAPYFTAAVLAGRSAAQRAALLRRFTDLLAGHLDVDPALVRGQVVEVDPANWGIGGEPATAVRAAEIAARPR